MMRSIRLRQSIRLLCTLLVLLTACVPERAQARQSPPPATCAKPDVAPATITGVSPIVPDLARHYGIGGSVIVAVTIDEAGRVAGAKVVDSPAALFDDSAVAAARASRFSPQIRDCRPRGGTFAFVVDFAPDALPPQVADPLAFFPGTWRCSTSEKLSLETFVRDPGAARLIHAALPAPRETFEQSSAHVWRLSDTAGHKAIGYPWVDPRWSFTSSDREIDYERIDERTFERTTMIGRPNGIRTTTRCTKTSA